MSVKDEYHWQPKLLANNNVKNHNDETSPWLAALLGCLGVIKLLTNRGVDMDVKNHNGETPLSLAVARGRLEIVKFLVCTVDADIGNFTKSVECR